MITEIAKLTIDLARASEFECAVAECAETIESEGRCRAFRLMREIENPVCYYLFVAWDSVEDHKALGQTRAADRWKTLVMPFYTSPSIGVHAQDVATYF